MRAICKCRIIFFVSFSIACLLLPSCSRGVSQVDLDSRNIICFGDSITEGYGATPGEDFPSRLAEKLGYPVINAGRSGDTTHDALARLKTDVLEKNPGLVIVEFGGNDFLKKIPQDETFKNLDDIVVSIQNSGATVVLAEVRVGVLFDEYYGGFKRIAVKRRVLLIPDIMQDIFNNPKYKSDGFHPNREGYRMIAERIYKYIAPLIKK